MSSVVPSDDTVIWRYMKLNSFLELLSGHLIQTRIDVLADAAEGAYGWHRIRFGPELIDRAGRHADGVADMIRYARTCAAATYWFEFDSESHGMWNVYGRAGESVAVETSVGALAQVLARQGELRIERMRYEPMSGEITRLHTLFFHKRREYKDEREIRSVQIFSEPLKEPIVDQRLSVDDRNALMRRIIVAPDSRRTFVDALKHVVDGVFAHENHGYTGRICASSLDEDVIPQ